jgi:hypothetical protein
MAASPHAAYVAAGFLAALAVASFMARRAAPRIGLLEAAAFGPLLLMALHLATAPTFAANYNLEPAGAYFKAATEKGRPAAIYGSTYHGQVHFLADIHAPFANPQTEAELRTWLDEHPQGVVGVVLKPAQPTRLAEMATNIVPFGNRRLALFDASALSPLLASTPR